MSNDPVKSILAQHGYQGTVREWQEMSRQRSDNEKLLAVIATILQRQEGELPKAIEDKIAATDEGVTTGRLPDGVKRPALVRLIEPPDQRFDLVASGNFNDKMQLLIEVRTPESSDWRILDSEIVGETFEIGRQYDVRFPSVRVRLREDPSVLTQTAPKATNLDYLEVVA